MSAAAILALWVTSATPLPAAANLRVSDTDLASASAAAVDGTVAAMAVVDEPGVGAIYTIVSLDVRRSWGVPGAPDRVDVKVLGGTVGRRRLQVDGQADFAVGEHVFVFLEVRPRDRTFSVTGLARGKWTVDDAGSGPRLDRLETLARLVGRAVRAPASMRVRLARAAAEDRPEVTADSPASGRWHRADSSVSVAVDASAGGVDALPGASLQRALSAWSGVGALALSPGLPRAPRCFGDPSRDGRISIAFGDPCDEIADTSPTLALGAAFFDAADTRVVAGVAYAGITSGVIVLDDAPAKREWLTGACLDDVLTHELGHSIGLSHTTDSSSVMFPTLSGGCRDRAVAMPLAAVDRAAVEARYPASSISGPPAPPVGLMGAVLGSSVRLRWSAGAGPTPVTYHIQAGSAPGETDLGELTLSSAALDVSGVAAGVYYLRVVARNAFGASPVSAEIVVVVGTSIPAAPTGLMAAADTAGRVRLFWQAPSGDTSPTHYVLLVRDPNDDGRLVRVAVQGTSFAATGVAPGAYPVRVAAMNAFGVGPASAEILVVVPQ